MKADDFLGHQLLFLFLIPIGVYKVSEVHLDTVRYHEFKRFLIFFTGRVEAIVYLPYLMPRGQQIVKRHQIDTRLNIEDVAAVKLTAFRFDDSISERRHRVAHVLTIDTVLIH